MPKRILKGGVKAAKWYWNLPDWFKYLKILAVFLYITFISLAESLQQQQAYQALYQHYYNHYYTHFIAKRPASERPRLERHYAYYADFYARYYTSPAYRASEQYALPEASVQTVSYPKASPVARFSMPDPGLALIKRFEGLRLEPYFDAGGKLTIGYGHLLRPGEYYTKISEREAHALLKEDVKVAEAYVKRYVRVPLTPNQFAALVSLVYNIGPGHFQKSALLSALNRGRMDSAAQEFLRWNKVGRTRLRGLTERRIAEKRLFES